MNEKWDEFVKEAETLGCRTEFGNINDAWFYKLFCPNGEAFGRGVRVDFWDEDKAKTYFGDSGLKTLALIKTGTIFGKPISLKKEESHVA